MCASAYLNGDYQDVWCLAHLLTSVGDPTGRALVSAEGLKAVVY